MNELMLIVTNKCNLNCSYCYEKNKSKKIMSKEIAKKSIDFFIKNTTANNRIDLTFHGGEPLLEFDLIKYTTEYLKEKSAIKNLDPHFSLTTNGTLVNAEMVEYFTKNNFKISLSLDGKEETHNLHRKTLDSHNTYNKVINAAYLLKENNCDLNIRMTITPETVDKLVENVQWLRKEGFSNIIAVPDSFADWNEKFHLLEKAYKILQKEYLDSLNKNKFYFGEFDGKFSQYIRGGKTRFCNAGFAHFVVNPDGNLYPCSCVMDNEEFCFGKLENEIYKKKRKESIEKYLSPKDECTKCSINHFCQGRKCSFLNYVSTGYLNVSSEFRCKHEKMLYKIVGEIIDELYKRKNPFIMKILHNLKNNPSIIPSSPIKNYLQV